MISTLRSVRFYILALMLLAACAPAPPPEPPKVDQTKEAWYAETVDKLTAMNREAQILFQNGQRDQAAAIIAKGEDLTKRLLAVPQPTLAAVEAASDMDHLYGRMLLTNRHYGWARTIFQKDEARWRNWSPQTPETARRRKLAESAIAECDRHL